jgi:hypothetical protein
MRFKVGASIVVLRRAGAMSAFSELNTFLLASEMLVVPSGFNVVFGARPGEIQQDREGLWRLRSLAEKHGLASEDEGDDERRPHASVGWGARILQLYPLADRTK